MLKRRNLPHIYPEEAIFFITFRLHGCIPLSVLKTMKEEQDRIKQDIKESIVSKRAQKEALYVEEKRYFAKYDQALNHFAKPNDV